MCKIIAFVPAKRHSTRLLDKNIKILGNKPLFCHAIDIALNSKLIEKVVIDSDSDSILCIGENLGAEPLKRPDYLATNEADGNDLAYWEANNYPESKIIIQLSPTAPFIKSASIDRAINTLISNGTDSVVGVYRNVFYEWSDNKPVYFNNGKIPNSYNKNPIIYETMGLCVTSTRFALTHRKRINIDSCLPYYLSKIEAVDINTEEDFEFAEMIWIGMNVYK